MAFTQAVGPIESSSHMMLQSGNFGPMSIPEYVAGFLYGLTGDLNLVTIEACYNSSKELIPYVD